MSATQNPRDPTDRAWDAALVNRLDCSYDFGCRADDEYGTCIYDPDSPEAFISMIGKFAHYRRDWR